MALPADAAQLAATQGDLATAAARQPLHRWDPAAPLGGCFVCFDAGDRPFAGAAVLAADHRLIAATSATAAPVTAPYVPGLLALRELPILVAVMAELEPRPPLLLVNATGRDHPRRAGLALHLGAVLDLPTIGVTHRPLLAADTPPRWDIAGRGATEPIVVDGEAVADWVVTRTGCRAVVAHPGWCTDRATARAVVVAATGSKSRTPEPIRVARQSARTARARAHGLTR